jgi:hypothetical protein
MTRNINANTKVLGLVILEPKSLLRTQVKEHVIRDIAT